MVLAFLKLFPLRKNKKEGGDLLSHPKAVPSALKDFTSLFGMVKGVSPSLLPPTILCQLNDFSSVLARTLFFVYQYLLISIIDIFGEKT